jgi:hypothetical protein
MPAIAANSGDTALAGRDGERLTALIDRSETKGSGLLQAITRNALQRHLTGTGGHYSIVASGGLFSADETQRLTSYLAAVIATGDLLGRTRLREKMAKAIGAGGLHRFAEADERPFAYLPAETVPILPPTEAARYFARLVPSLGVDVIRYGEAMQRAAFTMALATEKTILSRVQEIILAQLSTGKDWSTTPAAIDQILAEAGLSPANPQYSQMVFRTNAMDAFNVGQHLELEQSPEVKAFFPAWQYLGIADGREGDDHRPHFYRYYPTTLSFHYVRGPRVFNCRCSPNYIDRYQWDKLVSGGAFLSYV